ncbi:MAG TPA: ABC transporter substrate-binding protein [Acidimicrobiales bacterium]|nr:ABC transporter substrate-binding protein [Acidimicrobiales bacterium]
MPRISPRTTKLVALAISATIAIAACSSSKSTTASPAATTAGSGVTAPATINLGFTADMQVPDPDIFYEIEGNSVVTSAYEGLVRYKPDSNQIEPALAQSDTVSSDGMTYTFKLRPNVTFHDGTTMTSNDVKASFTRRTALGATSAPGYMLADVTGYDTPDPLTFIVHLKNPVSPFLDYLAAPYGPKVSSAILLSAHAGSDMDQTWLKTHDAGTGPFTMSDFVPGDHYTLTRFDAYWGGKPAVAEIHIAILPDISTQQLELKGGQLQMIIHGLSKDDIASYEGNSKFQVQRFPALFKTWLMVNENKGLFKDQGLRTALQSAINKQQIVDQVYGKDATVSNQIYPAGELAAGTAADAPKYDPTLLANAVKGLSNKKVDLAYSSDDARNQRDAEIIQTELQTAGLSATVRGIPIAQVFDLPNHPAQAPDLLLSTVNPDAAHPDTWARIFMNTKGTLNWLLCSVPAADAQMDVGLHTTDNPSMQSAYAKAGDLLVASGCFDSIADVKDVVVAQAGYGNWVHQLPTLFTVRFGDLKLSGS